MKLFPKAVGVIATALLITGGADVPGWASVSQPGFGGVPGC
ncbi:hypothetical protein N24_0850 [Corynebacterium suranareeae]|uniref:Uncharacterized protein n=1 Tax=Corynebacterium suranareeae TaxID=2506452 RepID=A0A161JNQ6_9CORY|nr:hypothetical protein N24_0850 [Corynebacterium suranareeae]